MSYKKIIENFDVIGRHKYISLKRSLDKLDQEDVDAIVLFKKINKISVAKAEEQVEKYEEKHNKKEITKEGVEYLKKLYNPVKPEKKEMTKDWLYKEFFRCYYENEGVKFVADKESIENIKPLIYYFIGDEENFKNCEIVSNETEISLRKGLMVVGSYGNGKTSIFRALEKALKRTNILFKGYSTNNVVKMYENCEKPSDKKQFDKLMLTGSLYFDDLLTEKIASNYGKTNVMRDILLERYYMKKRTYISLNYKDHTGNNLKECIAQIGEKYGSQVNDRVYKMFNILEFKGKSRRK